MSLFPNLEDHPIRGTMADEAGEAVTKAQTIATILYQRDTLSLRSSEIEGLISVDPKSFVRLPWKEVEGVGISRLAVQLGLAKSRSTSLLSSHAHLTLTSLSMAPSLSPMSAQPRPCGPSYPSRARPTLTRYQDSISRVSC